jgi:hypothetical protein
MCINPLYHTSSQVCPRKLPRSDRTKIKIRHINPGCLLASKTVIKNQLIYIVIMVNGSVHSSNLGAGSEREDTHNDIGSGGRKKASV